MINKDELCPILVVPATPHNNGIRFLLPKNQIDIEDGISSVVWDILKFSNGYNNICYIADKLNLDEDFVFQIVCDLTTLGIVSDSRELYNCFHKSSYSPDVYYRNLTKEDIETYTSSPRKPTKSGLFLDFEKDDKSPLSQIIFNRRTCRNFSDFKLSKKLIGNICYHAYSINNHTVPSGGALYPLKLYVLIEEDQIDISSGYYEYDPETDKLIQFSDTVDVEVLKFCFNDETLPFGSTVQIIIAADLKRQTYKYSNKGYKLTLIEAGHVAQNINLYSTENDLACCELGGVLDEPLMEELKLKEDEVSPLLAIAIGKKTEEKRIDFFAYKDAIEKKYVGDNLPIKHCGTYYFGKDTSFACAYSVYGENNECAGATARSYALALTKAIVEGYERYYSSIIRTDFLGSANIVPGKWINPNTIKPLTLQQIEQSQLTQFTEQLPIRWTIGYYKKSKEKVFIPSDLVFYGHETPINRICYGDSSGVAAHTNFDKAFQNGLYELIERDAIMRSWFEKKAPRKISFDSLPVYVKKRIKHWETEGRTVYIFDMMSPFAPTFQAVIISDDFPCFVSGASTSIENLEEAIIKALQEAEYSLLLFLQNKQTQLIDPIEVSSPNDHGLLYSSNKYIDSINWLWQDAIETHFLPESLYTFEELVDKLNPIVVNINEPNELIKIIRVFSEKCIPISFGYNMDHYTHNSVKALQLDIQNRKMPHYFA